VSPPGFTRSKPPTPRAGRQATGGLAVLDLGKPRCREAPGSVGPARTRRPAPPSFPGGDTDDASGGLPPRERERLFENWALFRRAAGPRTIDRQRPVIVQGERADDEADSEPRAQRERSSKSKHIQHNEGCRARKRGGDVNF